MTASNCLPVTILRSGIVFSAASQAKRDAIAAFQEEAIANGWTIEANIADEGGMFLVAWEKTLGFGLINRGCIDSDGNRFMRA